MYYRINFRKINHSLPALCLRKGKQYRGKNEYDKQNYSDINQERASYFVQNFSPSCVKELEEGGKCFAGGRGLAIEWDNGQEKLFRLSLLKANLQVLENYKIPRDNILVIDECTCCNEKFGSNRRETALASKKMGRKLSVEEAAHNFTVQAAFIRW